jgi:predicted metalloprotease
MARGGRRDSVSEVNGMDRYGGAASGGYRIRLVISAGLCLFLVAGCSSDRVLFEPVAPATPTQNFTTTRIVPTTPSCHPPSLAHCYTEASIRSYVNVVLPMITQFFRAKYTKMPEPRQYVFIALGQQVTSSCAGGQDATAYDYCPADENVYLGQAFTWQLYSQDGDAAPAIGLAHEWGHNIQRQVGIPEPDTDAETLNHENQADCIAGAWVQYAIQQGWFEQEDIDTTGRLLVTISSAETPNRTHGDLQERSASLEQGIEGGLSACNSFYPDNPIIS